MTTVEDPTALLSMEGTDLGTTAWVELTADRVAGFSDSLGDTGDLAAGYLPLSMVNLFLPELLTVESFSMGVNVGLDRVRFPAPAPAGIRVRAHGRVTSATEVKGGVQVTVQVTVERDRGDGSPDPTAACVADTVSRFFP